MTVGLPDWTRWERQAEEDLAKPITAGVRRGGDVLHNSLRARTGSALGPKVANAWRRRDFPSGARTSLDPAVLVWSKAPKIIDAFDKGATIVPINGARNLAIPTANVPRKGRRRMTPFEVESAFNQDLIIRKGQNGRLEAFVDVAVTRYYASQGRAYGAGRKLRRIGKPKLVLMFTLTPYAKMRKLLSIEQSANFAAASIPGFIASAAGR